MTSPIDDEFLAETYNRALELEKSGDIDAAIDAYRSVLVLDPDDHGGVRMRLAALGGGEVPSKAPDAYVATLFDQHADVFEAILCDDLGYKVPTLIFERLQALKLGKFVRMLDIGCGTGLAAEALETITTVRVGFDLSEAMVELAYDKLIYEDLYVAEAVEFLTQNDDDPFDLIVAADLLPYLGELDHLLDGVAQNMNPKGVLAFSTQARAEEASGNYAVGADHRYQHKLSYVREKLGQYGFEVLDVLDINVRNEEGAPTPGHLVIAKSSFG